MTRHIMSRDTSPEALRILAQVYRQMPMEQKAAIVDDLHLLTRQLFEQGFRSSHPEASDEALLDQYMRRTLPEKLYQQVRNHRDEHCQRLGGTAAGADGFS